MTKAKKPAKIKSTVNKAGNYTKPTLRKRLFNQIKAGGKGGKPGQWSARKAQMLAKKYKASGGGYKNQLQAQTMPKKDPKVGTGKKPKGSGRRLYTDENPKDTVSIKYATVKDARDTVAKVKKIRKPFARKIQILTVLEQSAKFANKPKQAEIARKGKEAIRKQRGK